MKKDNYDIPGYKFFLVVPNKKYMLGENPVRRLNKICEELDEDYEYGHLLIPFEEVDGLTIKDLDNIINGEIMLACYINIPTLNNNPSFHSMIVYHLFPKTPEAKKIQEEQSIDEYVIETMKKEYEKLSISKKRIYDCFLARYGSESLVKKNIRK